MPAELARVRSIACAPLLAALLLLVGGCGSGPRLPAEFVQQAQFLHDATLRSTTVNDKDVQEYFSLLGRRIVAGATAANANNTRDPTLANMQFHLVASDVVNAYGTGGGHVYVFDGLLQLCDSEEELAALMAVQYAHALDLDVQKTGMRPDVTATADPLSVSRVVFLFVTVPFSAEQCLAADKRAFELYVRAGWDPAKFAEAYERLRVGGYDLPPSTGVDGKARPALLARARAALELRQNLPAQARDWRVSTEADVGSFAELKGQARKASLSQQAVAANAADRGPLYLAAFPNVVLPAELPKQQQAQNQLRTELTPPAPAAKKIEPN